MVDLITTHVKDVYICRVSKFQDHRGELCELFNMNKYPEQISKFFPTQQVTFVVNRKLALRGLHISPYSKLLSCTGGSVYDVVVDLRPESATYLQWVGVTLSADNGYQLLVPPHCGHGYLALEEGASVLYCQGGCFDPSLPEKACHVFDPVISIEWPLLEQKDAFLISDKDSKVPFLKEQQFRPNRKRVLIISAKGQVGQTLYRMFQERREQYVTVGTTYSDNELFHYKLDLEEVARVPSRWQLVLDACKPHIVVVCGAMTNVNLCESHRPKAFHINCASIDELRHLTASRGVKLVFFSTNYVYNKPLTPPYTGDHCMVDMIGSGGGIGEHEATSCSVNVYGDSKLRAETLFEGNYTDVLIIRTSGVFGPDEKRKNFVYQLVSNLKAGNTMKLLTDEVQCPTYTEDLCNATLQLIEKQCSGIYHIVGPQAFNKYSLGVQLARIFQLDSSLLIPMTSEQLQLAAKRPKFAALSTLKFRQKFPDWKFHTLSEAIGHWKMKQPNDL
ncbi:dTDP-4-dehydrorhamnose reductase [Argonauta hians]